MQIGSLIRRAALYYGDAICLTEDARELSFREFDRLTDVLGNALLARGLEPGERVAVLLPNSIECLIAYYALAKAGLVRVGMNTRETLENHQYKLEDSGSRAVIPPPGRMPTRAWVSANTARSEATRKSQPRAMTRSASGSSRAPPE